MRNFVYLALVLLLSGLGCKSARQAGALSSTTNIVFLHINDVYEIAPLANGTQGGMARVATLRQELKAKYPHTYTVLSGDFVSPSVMGTVKLDGKRIAGAQMVDIMNRIGVDYVTFGNHEFDIKEEDLLDRINESNFEWISSNVFHKTGQGILPFVQTHANSTRPLPPYKVLVIPAGPGKTLRLGMIGVCLPFNKQPYVYYEDVYDATRRTVDYLKDKTDFVVALTHLNLEEDSLLAVKVPELALIMGGHEHENHFMQVGETFIAKADANAKSAYVHILSYDPEQETLTVKSQLRQIDSTIALDPLITERVKDWEDRAYASFAKTGFDLNKTIAELKEPLDGLEAHIRAYPTNLGTLIARSLYECQPGTDLAFLNSGSIRIDDYISGKMTQFDLIRALPFGGPVMHVDMEGELLKKILQIGLVDNLGKGGYLQTYNVAQAGGKFLIGGKLLDPQNIYRVCLPSFLLMGIETNFEFLTFQTPGLSHPDEPGPTDLRRDIRLVVIQGMKE